MTALIELKDYESKKRKLTTASIIGHTRSREAKIWVRVYKEGIWHLVVTRQKLNCNLATLDGLPCLDFISAILDKKHLTHDFEDQTDLTHCFTLNGLAAGVRHYYYLMADDSIQGLSRKTELGSNNDYFFKTLSNASNELTFGFYSCHDPFSVSPHNEGAWPLFKQVLLERKADFVIGGGDQVYCDTNRATDIQDLWAWLKNNKNAIIAEMSDVNGDLKSTEIVEYFKSMYRIYYRIYWCFESVQDVFKQFPQYMIWDDHEIMDGWGSLTEEERKLKLRHWLQDDQDDKNYQLVLLMFKAAALIYQEYQHVHNPTTPIDLQTISQCQWDYGFIQGSSAFYMLDVRGHHDCESPSHRVLGQLQFNRIKAWLAKPEVKNSKAIFISSPVPIVHWNETFVNTADFGGQKDDFMDEWGHETNHDERNLLLETLLESSQLNGQTVVVLSGDVHCASAFKITNQDKYPDAKLFNVTSSAISRSPAPKIATAAMQKSAAIDNYEGGRFEQLYRFAGENNFLMVSSSFENDETNIYTTIYWSEQNECTGQKIIKL